MATALQIISLLQIPAILIALIGILPALIKIKKELMPNHGSSLNDAVARSERGVDRIEENQKRLQKEIGDIRESLHEIKRDVQTLQTKEILS